MPMWQICGLLLTTWAGSVLAAPSSWSLPTCDNETEALTYDGVQQCPYYYNLLERALLANGSGNMYRLQQAFFPSNKLSPSEVLFNLTITVDEVQNGACEYDTSTFTSCSGGDTNCSFNRSYQYRDSKPRSLLDCIILEVIQDFEWVVFYLQLYQDEAYLLTPHGALCASGHGQPTVNILLHLEQLPCNPDSGSTDLVVSNLVTWVS